MFAPALALTILSFVAIVVGTVWTLLEGGCSQRTSGPEVGGPNVGGPNLGGPNLGVAIMEEVLAADEDLDQVSLAEKSTSAFRGQATAVEASTAISFSEIKAAVRAGKGRQALPVMVAIGGLLGLILFGSLALFTGLDSKVIGVVALGLSLYTIFNIARGFARA